VGRLRSDALARLGDERELTIAAARAFRMRSGLLDRYGAAVWNGAPDDERKRIFDALCREAHTIKREMRVNPSDLTAIAIDDRARELQHVEAALKWNGIRVLSLHQDGAAGLAAVLAEQPTLAFVDYQMPQMSGFEVLQAIRAAGISTLVVMATGTTQMKATLLEHGARHVLVKPYDTVTFWNELRPILVVEGILDAEE
jgi:CheY-like chemotaxis protein